MPRASFPKCYVRLFLRATRHALRAICILAALTCQAHAQTPTTLALLPFENVSGSVASVRIIMPLIEHSLRDKGYRLIDSDKIETFLSAQRIRNTGMLSRAQLNVLRREFGVDLALVGSVDLFYESDDNLQWGVSSRIISTTEANVLWAESIGRTGGDYTGMLGLGTITSGTELAREVVKVLFQSLPAAGTIRTGPANRNGKTLHVSGGRNHCGVFGAMSNLFAVKSGYRSPDLDGIAKARVAVAIIENASERRGAGRILTDVLTTALFRQGRFDVIDPGEVNEVLIALGRTSYGGMDIAALREFRKHTGIDAIFRGTVYRYNEGLKREATTSPEVALDATLLDTESGKILWFASNESTGDDCQIVLDFGIVRSMVSLLLRAVGQMLDTL